MRMRHYYVHWLVSNYTSYVNVVRGKSLLSIYDVFKVLIYDNFPFTVSNVPGYQYVYRAYDFLPIPFRLLSLQALTLHALEAVPLRRWIVTTSHSYYFSAAHSQLTSLCRRNALRRGKPLYTRQKLSRSAKHALPFWPVLLMDSMHTNYC
jgi:hypothetical protein